MTKMMSMLLIMEAIEKGSLKWNDIVTVSENASGTGRLR
jgi:D-alanyl-D-alanine carboxypeptidase (penicillin-binding protein 5/6)